MFNSAISCNFPSNVHNQLDWLSSDHTGCYSVWLHSFCFFFFVCVCVCLFVCLFICLVCFALSFFPSMMIYILTIHIHTELVSIEVVQTSYHVLLCETNVKGCCSFIFKGTFLQTTT